MDKIIEEDIIFYERPLTLQNEKYDKSTKELRVEKVKVENKRIIHEEQVDIDLSNIDTKGLILFHQYIIDAVAPYVTKVIAENLRIKMRLKELEDILNLVPMLMTPLAI